MMVVEFMKASGRETSAMEMDMKYLKMVIAIEDNTWIINLTEREFINGIMEKFMMGSGFRAKKTVSESGKDCSMTAIRENGKITRPKDSALTSGVMGTGMKVSGWHL